MKEAPARRILVVDDNRAIHQDFEKILAPRTTDDALAALDAELFDEALPQSAVRTLVEFEVSFASQGEEGAYRVEEATRCGRPYLVAFVDMRMPPGWNGVQTIRRIWEIDPTMQCVICTAYSDYSWEEILDELGLSDRLLLLRKPFDPAEVRQLACTLTEKWHLARHAHLKLEQLRAMVEAQTAQLAESEARYALAAAGANDGLWDWNLRTGEFFYASRWNAIVGLADSETTGGDLAHWVDRVHPEDRAHVEAALQGFREGARSQLTLEHRMRHADGQYRWVCSRGALRRDESGTPLRAAGSQTDITNRKLAEAQLRFDALHDSLTGLPNREMLRQRIEQCISRRKADPSFRFAALFLDLDRFKVINDSLGHSVGDQLLVEVAVTLESTIRQHGATRRGGTEWTLARLGGDEFVVLLSGSQGDLGALELADHLLQSFESPILCDQHIITTGFSVGVALGEPACGQAEDILRDADTALYRAKSRGRGCYQLFSDELHVEAINRFELERELRRAIERRDFVLHYQPIVSLADGHVEYLEALLRWIHPERGCISPGEFIPLAEESGLITVLGDFVLDQACLQLIEWRSQGLQTAVNVNVSGRQLVRTSFSDQFHARLARSGLPPDALRIEVTESTLMDQMAIARCEEVAQRGGLVYLDDFGTGYSSLSYLTRLPVHALKIDRSFVCRLVHEPTTRAITNTILTLAAALKLEVVAEGIETEEEAQQLRAMGCKLGQGYLWSKPIPAERVAELLSNSTRKAPSAAE